MSAIQRSILPAPWIELSPRRRTTSSGISWAKHCITTWKCMTKCQRRRVFSIHFPSLYLLRLNLIVHSVVLLENAMSAPTAEPSSRVVPAHLGFLAIYNPSLGTTDETLENQIVYYSSSSPREHKQPDVSDPQAAHNAIREQNNEQLRQIGLAQGMVEFGRSFSDGRAVDTVETEKSRIILHELELGWWVLAVSVLLHCGGISLTKCCSLLT